MTVATVESHQSIRINITGSRDAAVAAVAKAGASSGARLNAARSADVVGRSDGSGRTHTGKLATRTVTSIPKALAINYCEWDARNLTYSSSCHSTSLDEESAMTSPVLFNDGWHVGPLFVPRLIRPVVRPKGKEGMVHRQQTRRATPPWADLDSINLMYAKARRLTAWTGELYVVDHIVPKINPAVCGLHVPANLRVIHWLENAKKGAFWWPDMPMQQLDLF